MYLIRHDAVSMAGACYGQTDVPTLISYAESAKKLKPYIPDVIDTVFTSPLSRCSQLTKSLFDHEKIHIDDRLKEVNFGAWEARAWDDIPRQDIDAWAKTPDCFQFPEGEHLEAFYQRVKSFWSDHPNLSSGACIVTHAGVIRALVSIVQQKDWQECMHIPVPFLGLFHLTETTLEQLNLNI